MRAGLGRPVSCRGRKRLRSHHSPAAIVAERLGGYRRVNLPGFPYYVAYFIRGERILVAAVGHGSRHPNYWKRRGISE